MGRISGPKQGHHVKQLKVPTEQEPSQLEGARTTGSRDPGTLQRILRRAQVEEATGLPRPTIYDKIGKGTFPRPIKLGTRSEGWLEAEIIAWQKARIAERDDRRPQAKNAVARLPPQRPTADRAGNDGPLGTVLDPLCK
jgi:prophage regulatory protein